MFIGVATFAFFKCFLTDQLQMSSKTNGGPASYRRKKRAAMHAEAELADVAMPTISDHPDIPGGDAEIIQDESALRALVSELREAGSFAYDTEFIGEETFYPKICVIQVATSTRLALVDPFEIKDLMPMWEVIADSEVATLVHDGGQDLDPVRRAIGQEPQGIIDTQVCAAFLDMPWPSSLAKVVERFAGHQLAKGHTFTEWDRRPLTPKQQRYAADDVRFLPHVWNEMHAMLEEAGRLEWAMAECSESRRRGGGSFDVDRQMKRISKNGKMRPRGATVLRELVLMRHELAKGLDLPHKLTLSDEAMVELMRAQPDDQEALAALRNVPRRAASEYGVKILEAVKLGKAAELVKVDHRRPSDETAEDRMRIDALWSAISLQCLARGISPTLVLSRAKLSGWYLDRREGNERELFEQDGWRQTVIGEWFERFVRGEDRLEIVFHDGKPSPC